MNWIDDIFDEYEELATLEQLAAIEQLAAAASVCGEWMDEVDLNKLTKVEAEKIINWLTQNQVNRIHAGLNYNQTYILWHLRNI
jgi:hypothetical protein